MSLDHELCRAFGKGMRAGFADQPKAECPFAPFSQSERWAAWMIGYEEGYERYSLPVTSSASDAIGAAG